MKKDSSGRVIYSDVNVLKVESIGNFAQPGQVHITLRSNSREKIPVILWIFANRIKNYPTTFLTR